jgi:hypothetical protein
MSIFRKQPDEQPKYGSDDLRRGVRPRCNGHVRSVYIA